MESGLAACIVLLPKAIEQSLDVIGYQIPGRIGDRYTDATVLYVSGHFNRAAAIRIEELHSKLAEIEKNSEESTVKLNEKLKKANISRNNALGRANALKKELSTTNAAKVEAEKYAKILEKQLEDVRAEIAKAKKDAADLRTQLDAAVQELSVLKAKQAEEPRKKRQLA